jgi:hypothetical protein
MTDSGQHRSAIPSSDDHVRELVAAAPGLTDEQSRRLAVLLLRATSAGARQDTAA